MREINLKRKKKKKVVKGVYIFVTTRDGDVPIIPLSAHHSLYAISDKVPGLQAVAHTPRPHGDGVADPNGVEPERDHSRIHDAFLNGLGEVKEVHVAGVALVPDRGYPNLGLVHVVLGQAHAVEDGLGTPLRLGLRDAGAVLVQLVGGGGGGFRRGLDGDGGRGLGGGGSDGEGEGERREGAVESGERRSGG